MGDGDGSAVDRRRFLARLAAAGVTGLAAERAWAQAETVGLRTADRIAGAAELFGLELTDAERELMSGGVDGLTRDYERLRKVPVDNAVAPALSFSPLLPGTEPPDGEETLRLSDLGPVRRPRDPEDLAFLPVIALSRLVHERLVSSEEVTELYLDRLRRYDPILHCVVTLTAERALVQARERDREVRAGRLRGPLHGIPWGAKDLFAVKGYPTTWGAEPYRDQSFGEDATVVQRLDEAGAVLVAKLTLGALATGDVWFGGQTCSPWDLADGSSGSSAGSSSAVAAGLVGFALGTETRGSILSPCTRCGTTGLRPTFGRVPRTGAMALAWSMDKVGPICRRAEDCAVVFAAIHGADGRDDSVRDAPFAWDVRRDPRSLRVAYLRTPFELGDGTTDLDWYANDLRVLDVVRGLGVELVPIDLPDLPVRALSFILNAEASAAFDDLTRSDRDELLLRQDESAWPNRLRVARMVPAVEYIQANRVRRLAMEALARLLDGFDVYLSPTYGGDNLSLTNLTGHPAVVVPNGFRAEAGTPTSVTFCGNLFRDAEALLLARAYQEATGHHLRRPPLPPA